MNKIAINNIISEYVLKNNIILTDKLNEQKRFTNITEYEAFLKSNFQLYKNQIESYANSINNEILKLESFIDCLMEIEKQ